MKKIAIFASGAGTNLQAIIDAIENGSLTAEIAALVTDKPDCFAVERARCHNIPVFSFIPKNYASKEEYEKEIAFFLIEKSVSLIVLAGYMRLIGEVLLSAFHNRIINIHPALLPAFPGKNGIQQAYDYGVKIFGVTVHYVDSGIDTGKIIAQECIKAEGNETLHEIEEKIHVIEHQLYPRVIKEIL
ncbi:MAG: phosphoribosylglycinamide formyltransferase [Bacteroidetes bacterium]|nr:phosphoribosylglycinamide formyltransferase [Bacteroidota bacterium]MCL2302850.1 phosphoribosylglycinamide formyltransferase [Lentimicrobiaceae bacterium]